MIEAATTCLGNKKMRYTCDECGRECRPISGFWEDRIYSHDGQDLCVRCLLDELESTDTINRITE